MTVPFSSAPVALTGTFVALEAFTPQISKGKLIVQFGDGTGPFPLMAGPTGPGITGAAVVGGRLVLTVGTTPPTTIDAGPAPVGTAGRGIASISATGLVTFTDGGTSQLTLPPGQPGAPGTGGGGTALAVDGGSAALNGSETLDGGGAAG